jgi:hypothetical protein
VPGSGVGRPALWRWVLLAGVISGILGMHVFTGGDMAGHGPLPTGTAGMDGMAEHPVTAAAQAAFMSTGWLSEVPFGMSHDGMAACILFLVVGGAALLLALLTGRNSRLPGSAAIAGGGTGSGGVMRRGPPGPGLPRLALCVYRI